MSKYNLDELKEALRAINSIIYKCEKAKEKFPMGTAHHTLLDRRLKAMYISKDFISADISKKEVKMSPTIYSEDAPVFLANLDKLHTTALGQERIKINLDLDIALEDIIPWCREIIAKKHSKIFQSTKNWYVETEQYAFTINRRNYNIITAHKRKNIDKI